MRKTIILLLLSTYLISVTDLKQILKLPFLIEHYFDHKTENQSLTFWDFIYSHYALENIKHTDYKQDMKLPFKSHSNCCSSVSYHFVDNFNYTFEIQNDVFVTRTPEIHYKTLFLKSAHLSSIWQPPRQLSRFLCLVIPKYFDLT